MADFKYEITERIAVLSESGKWTKELNKVTLVVQILNLNFHCRIINDMYPISANKKAYINPLLFGSF